MPNAKTPLQAAGIPAEIVVSHAREWVGESHLLSEPERQQKQAARHILAARRIPMEQIAKEIPGANDGSGHQLREEADEQRVVDGIADGALLAPVNIHHVRHALKGVEADAERQHDVQPEGSWRASEQGGQDAGEEIVILEKAEESQVGGKAQD
jgi:hypothetical protein